MYPTIELLITYFWFRKLFLNLSQLERLTKRPTILTIFTPEKITTQMSDKSYDLFFKFIETYAPSGFQGINNDDGFVVDLEKQLQSNEQSFYIADMLQLKVLYASKGNSDLTGLTPGETSPYHFMSITHNDDLNRRSLGLSKLIKMSNDLYKSETGTFLLSTSLRHNISADHYADFLVQCLLFYRPIPYKTVYLMIIRTNIEQFNKIKYGHHFYAGNDLTNFRFPDESLLSHRNAFTHREFEIIQLIAFGLGSKEISEKLFISENTVNTHRRNILKKTKKTNLSDLILELKDQGII